MWVKFHLLQTNCTFCKQIVSYGRGRVQQCLTWFIGILAMKSLLFGQYMFPARPYILYEAFAFSWIIIITTIILWRSIAWNMIVLFSDSCGLADRPCTLTGSGESIVWVKPVFNRIYNGWQTVFSEWLIEVTWNFNFIYIIVGKPRKLSTG